MRKDGNFADADHRHGGQQDAVKEDHPLGCVQANEEAANVDEFQNYQEADQEDKGPHRNRPTRGRVKVLFKNVCPVHQNQNENAKEGQGTGGQDDFAQRSSDPGGVFRIPGEDGDRSVAGRPYRGRNEEPDRSQHRGYQNEGVKGSHHRRLRTSLLPCPSHAFGGKNGGDEKGKTHNGIEHSFEICLGDECVDGIAGCQRCGVILQKPSKAFPHRRSVLVFWEERFLPRSLSGGRKWIPMQIK
mmetsp:Transcript_91278/g.136693  ORF Transcript_91278/g.136693 Transcript_91278/m.136693 type:complete len:243 (-) Transcript_91278:108-836(-)